MKHPSSVSLVEVGPRDGLQNEARRLESTDKITLIKGLIDAGLRRIEVASFVSPKAVPQMADAEAVIAGLPARDDLTLIGLVLNMRGYERALATRRADGGGINEIGCVAVASNSFALRNQGQSRDESLSIAGDIIRRAHGDGLSAQITLSAVYGCPFEGEIDPATVIDMARRAADFEPDEIALADTIGVAVPAQVRDLFGSVREAVPHIPLRAHFHNTRNTGIANAWAALEAGVATLDASVGGLGGCPFAPAATGNIATEDLVYLLHRSAVTTDADLDQLIALTGWIGKKLGRDLPAQVSRAGPFPPANLKEAKLKAGGVQPERKRP
ncbi:hydroxymethylglutaryl-CoA lyase [Iodidimonas nitroreducens]|uniref:Hydroxymethylglutaryl-CoA lyase n=1 Tax=Iodidimonas nitroreducens TaxID=1236968 RepID=A0A5A7N7R1_9PROT|nr:hydroxymethylglutaryl-CoA lyase [Iodidimonas nitroreducens]GAK34571.1 hydroxymethylglutaryl-CoA lyase YngG [alpha proteobacterium Q-1]GER04373.1 hydroxymethylglutaryl-CoA lyase [Iodidimonas nitroreducens]